MIVVDTHIIAYFFIEGDHTASAQALWQRDSHWRLPPLWRHEFLNVLATYVRFGGVEQAAAMELWRAACTLCVPMETDLDLSEALALSIEKQLSAYDAQFVTLARSLAVPLVSEDKRLRDHCSDEVITIAQYL